MAASCWLFLYDLYYDARNHEHRNRSNLLSTYITLKLCFRLAEQTQLEYATNMLL